MLPPNILRPSLDDYTPAWGEMTVPPHFGGRALEIGQLLDLTHIGACIGILPGHKHACPLHYHFVEEELFFVLDGEVTVRELAPEAKNYTEYSLRKGELVAYPPGTAIAHQSHNRTDHDVRYLALSTARAPGEIAVYPDSGKTLVRGIGVGVFGAETQPHIDNAQAIASQRGIEHLEIAERPAWVQGPKHVPERQIAPLVFGRPLAKAAGAKQISVNADRLMPGAVSNPLHWHTQDEELLVVLSGYPTLRQLRDNNEERIVLQPNDIVAWKAGDGIAHQLLCEESEATVLIVGTSKPDDVIVFPEENRIYIRALGRSGAFNTAPYFAGET